MTAPVRDEIERLRREIDRHSRLYYVEAKPEISDREFDKLLARLSELENAHPEYDRPDSPTHRVGGEPMLAAFQTGGFSHSGDLPGWRTFITTKVESVEPREETFTPRSDCERMAEGMVEIFART